MTEAPDDMIDGPDPAATITVATVGAFRYTCNACGYAEIDEDALLARERLDHHILFGHPAARNPDITCQAAPPWDHERWCVRPVDHDGDHWTPSFGGGRSWTGDWSMQETP